jgi:hypothetical protein
MKFKKIISVCSKKDADVWKFASHKIIKYIESEIYEVIVPDSEVDLFKRISPKNYRVINETHYSSNLKEILRKNSIRKSIKIRMVFAAIYKDICG